MIYNQEKQIDKMRNTTRAAPRMMGTLESVSSMFGTHQIDSESYIKKLSTNKNAGFEKYASLEEHM